MDRSEFVSRLSAIVDDDDLGFLSNFFDPWSSSNNVYKGMVFSDSFQIKKRRIFMEMNINAALASGTLSEQNGKLIIDSEINGFSNVMILFFAALLIFYAVFFVAICRAENSIGLIAIPFLLLHGIFMGSIPYMYMRHNVKRMKYDLERELYYLTKEQ